MQALSLEYGSISKSSSKVLPMMKHPFNVEIEWVNNGVFFLNHTWKHYDFKINTKIQDETVDITQKHGNDHIQNVFVLHRHFLSLLPSLKNDMLVFETVSAKQQYLVTHQSANGPCGRNVITHCLKSSFVLSLQVGGNVFVAKKN